MVAFSPLTGCSLTVCPFSFIRFPNSTHTSSLNLFESNPTVLLLGAVPRGSWGKKVIRHTQVFGIVVVGTQHDHLGGVRDISMVVLLAA